MNNDYTPTNVIEKFKLVSDYLKHLTTLSTGSIILLAAFLEKIFTQPSWKKLVVVALGGFMLSVVSSVAAYTYLIYTFPESESEYPSKSLESIWVISILGAWMGFLAGVVSMTAFAIKNLLK
jgi:hypothetical protein